MSRISGVTEQGDLPRIDRASVQAFFKARASKASELGHVQAVIYQDKHPELAARRDAAEKAKLLPLLKLSGTESILDVGCGTGRWADVVVDKCRLYVGSDFSEELIEIAASRFPSTPAIQFVCTPCEKISQALPGRHFNIILSMGLFIYLNDEELIQTLRAYAALSADSCQILLREPIATRQRLTIHQHYSEDMDQIYNAIYRTERELLDTVQAEIFPKGFKLSACGEVYETALNNRADTMQKWYLLERS